MTTTISKHELQLQQQLQHQQLQFAEQQRQQQQQQQQQRSSILLKPPVNSSLLMPSPVSQLDNTTTIATTKTINAYNFSNVATPPPPAMGTTLTTTNTTSTRLDSSTTNIQIDSLNNNNNSNTNVHTEHTRTTTGGLALTPTSNVVHLPATSPSGLNNNNSAVAVVDSPETEPKTKTQKRRSLLNFKSFDFHIKSLYTGLRNGNKHSHSQCSSVGVDNADSSTHIADTPGRQCNRMPPYLKIESVDAEESENLLLDYPQSPYSSRRNSSHDDNRSSSQLLHINRYEMSSRSQASSPSPYFLSPYATESGNIRRSSTSDIMSCKRSGTSSASDSRRPSTSDLLRKARERRGSEARMGRSVSHGGLSRGGFRSSCGSGGGGAGGGAAKGGRRTSMAF